ncbi:LysR family transcriptional regulator [Specibacter cremeus]|uniref:LysR family transcriptional regulator n=1 Tax=Specibacter cremeus TaxID=1629051 RepID=UPI000F769D2D|nr:LysR family transcriptional regulator [Specibacter cremeus]
MAKPFTLTQLRYFAVVARLRSMTGAAAELLVTQSAVSTAVAELEKAVDAQLFVRNRSAGLKLTGAGSRFAQELDSFLDHADRLYESATGLSSTLSGALSVGVFAPLAPFRLPVILQMFHTRFPGVDVTFLEADLGELRTAVLDGRCDVAIMYGLGLDSRFQATVVERIPPHVLVAAGHPAARTPDVAVSLHDFADEPMILLDLPLSRDYYESLARAAGVVPKVHYRFSGYETVRSFVAQGHGYALLNQRVANDRPYSGGRVVALDLADELPPIEVALVRSAAITPTRRTLAFEQVCADFYAGAPTTGNQAPPIPTPSQED